MNKKQAKNLAKLIYRETGGKAEILEKFSKILVEDSTPKALAILENLDKLIVKNEKQNQLTIESAFGLNSATETEIKTNFEKLLGKKLDPVFKENKNLIGGLKITNGDFVWENSILSNLEQLKGAINQ